MESIELTLHHPVEITYENWYGPRTVIASVYEIYDSGNRRCRIVDIDAQTEMINVGDIISISECNLTEKEEDLLVCLSMLYATEQAEEKKYQESKQRLLSAIQSATKELKNTTGLITTSEFVDELNDLLARKVGYDVFARSPHTVDGEEYVDIAIEKHVVRFADPKRFKFLHGEYGHATWIDTNSEDYKTFVVKNAPDTNKILEKISVETKVGVILEGENNLWTHRSYKVKLPNGFTRKQLNELEKIL